MAENFILLHYGTKSWNRQIVDSATLFATRLSKIPGFTKQFAGLIFSFTLSTCISIIETRIFVNMYYLIKNILKTSNLKSPKYLRAFSLRPKIRRSYKKSV